ncbi:MAG: hypothetical protein E7610_06005 [Ruminococcaceae bacterium]|nr:hypothetical protein [Oscillospiraceae bacterium]
MIALIRNGFFEDFDARAAMIWVGLLSVGGVLGLLLRKRSARLAAALGSLALVGVCDLMAALPTPAGLAGDGYAVTQEIGLIGASFLLLLAVGIWLGLTVGYLRKGRK